MKVCPACNESFGDELRFCDLDGTRLVRQRASTATSAPTQNKAWSLLGAGLLLGALVISAASIIFFPKARVSPSAADSQFQPAPAPSQPNTSQAPAAETAAADDSQPEMIEEEVPPVEVKKKDKPVALGNENFNGSIPNPKAAAIAAEEIEKPVEKTEEATLPPPSPKRIEPPPPVKTAGDVREQEETPKPSQAAADSKKDQKRTANSKDANKNSDAKKKEGDKKKGGFFSKFKKIFGKD